MLIRCVKADSAVQGEAWLSVGQIYLVLGLYVMPKGLMYRLITSELGDPALHSASFFEIVSGKLSRRWGVQIDDDGRSAVIEPMAWLENGFWDKYFDGDNASVAIFSSEVKFLGDEEDYIIR